MKSIVKLFGISTCCLVGGITAANAEPTLLADADLDGVTAGSCSGIPNCVDPPLGGFQQPGSLRSPFSRLRLFLPVGPEPSGPVPTEPPGCETGACEPGAAPTLVLEPIISNDFPPIEPILISRLFGGCGGPAATCPGVGF